MKYFYDKSSDSLYLTLAERKYADSVEASPGVVLDFDASGRLIGIDLEHASRTVDVTDLALHAEPAQSEVAGAKINGAEIKRQRETLGLSQAQLGRYLAVAANTIARWERGELKVEHPGMLSLALSALTRRDIASVEYAPKRPLRKRRASLLKATDRSSKRIIAPASPPRSVGRRKRK